MIELLIRQIKKLEYNIYKPLFTVFLLFISSNSALSESYSNHRLDDKNYLYGGRKPIVNEGRIESILPDTEQVKNTEVNSRNNIGLAFRQFLAPRFYSQKGGDKEDLAGRYANQLNYSPEIAGFRKINNSKIMLLIAPIASYREDFILKRNVNRLKDLELVTGGKWNSRNYSLNLEAGRGFQRLDAYGVMFNGLANYAELNFYWKPINAKLSFLSLSYNYDQKNFTFKAHNSNSKLFGTNLVFQSMPYLSHIQIFYYQIFELGQFAERNLIQEDKPFKPKGKYIYNGFEFKTRDFFSSINSEVGVFSALGYRNFAEYTYQEFNSKSNTKGILSYLIFNWNLDKFLIRVGGLYSSKDNSSSIDRANNGYSSLVSDVRIFGGKSSFLLMETVNSKNGAIFREFDSREDNKYDTKGMEFVSAGLSYDLTKHFQITGILNHSNSNLGIGNEGILSSIYHFSSLDGEESGFLLASVCIARVNPVTQRKILYDEFRVDPDIKEFTRFYISGGIYF